MSPHSTVMPAGSRFVDRNVSESKQSAIDFVPRDADHVAVAASPPKSLVAIAHFSSRVSRLLHRLRLDCRKHFRFAWSRTRGAIKGPRMSSLQQYFHARSVVARALSAGLHTREAELPDSIPICIIPSLAGRAAGDAIIAEIDQDGFAFPMQRIDSVLFSSREQKLPRYRHQLHVVLRNNRLCVRKRFSRPSLSSGGIRLWLWGLLGYHFFTEAAALLRLENVPFVPRLRDLDVRTRTVWIDFINGDDMKKHVAGFGFPVHDLHLASERFTTDLWKAQENAQIEGFARFFAAYRPQIAETVLEMQRRGVFPQDIKLGNIIVGKNTRRLYWIDLERVHLSCGQPRQDWTDRLYREIDRWFGTELTSSVQIDPGFKAA